MIEFKTWEEYDSTIIEARLRVTVRTYIPNEYIDALTYPFLDEKIVKKQLASEINNILYGEITNKLLCLNDKIFKMVYSDSCTKIDIVQELTKNINEIIHSYEDNI